MMRGRFITLEGGEGAGKSTQARLLAESLRQRSLEVVTTREPGGTTGAEAIRSLLLDTSGPGWEPNAEALLFAAARSDHVDRLIRPALERGAWVVCDRFLASSRAYQGGGLGLADADLVAINRFGTGGLQPDLTLLIEVDPHVVAERLLARDGDRSDRIGGRDAAFHARVAAAFDRLAAEDLARVIRIDGSGTIEDTRAAIVAAVAPLLEAI